MFPGGTYAGNPALRGYRDKSPHTTRGGPFGPQQASASLSSTVQMAPAAKDSKWPVSLRYARELHGTNPTMPENPKLLERDLTLGWHSIVMYARDHF